MTDIACNLCGADDYTVLHAAGVAQVNQIVRCKHCGLIYSNPRVQGTDIDELVTWDAESVYRMLKEQDQQRREKQELQVKDYEDTRRYLAERHPTRGRMVEVGSSLGYLLDYFRKDGWDTLGVEPNKGFCLYAEREVGVNTVSTTLGEAGIAPNSVDALLMMHVIEHVPDPCGVFREVHEVLSPTGTFVLETPRYDTLMYSLLGKRERSLSCDGHIYFFTTKTLAAMARKCGFDVLKTTYVGRSLTLDRLVYNFGVMSKSGRLRRGLENFSRRWRLNETAVHLNVRDMERIYLRRT